MRFYAVFGNTLLITAGSVLTGSMLPFQLAMVPLYRLINGLHMVNTYHGAILIFTALNSRSDDTRRPARDDRCGE